MEILSRAVDIAVVTKCSLYCSRVAKNVTMKMRSRYQKFMAVSGAVCPICSDDQPQAKSFVMGSGKKVMSREKAIKKSRKRKNMAVAKTPLCLEAMKEGIKACVNAPSAKIRRKRLGSLKATKNISDQIEAPNAEAISTSRPKPVTRENKIPKLLVKMDFNRIMFFMIFLYFSIGKPSFYFFVCYFVILLKKKRKWVEVKDEKTYKDSSYNRTGFRFT